MATQSDLGTLVLLSQGGSKRYPVGWSYLESPKIQQEPLKPFALNSQGWTTESNSPEYSRAW